MSTPARLAKGTGLTLGRVAIALAGQIATVPIYLSHWDAQTFGVWLILQGMLGYLIVLSAAFQQYTYAELLKRGQDAPDALRTIWQASLGVGYVIALIEFCAILGFGPGAVSMAVGSAVSSGAEEISATLIRLLVLYSLVQLILMPFGALTGYALSVHGQFPRVAAWGLFNAALVLSVPAIAVLLGADLMTAGLAQIGAYTFSGMLSVLDMMRQAQRFNLLLRQRIDWRMGLRNALYCLPLAGRAFIETFRQQGFRILLGAYAGATSVTVLATTRTFANVLHQGLSTITAPLMPELMRYVVNRDQDRMEGAFSIVWLCVFVLLVPGALFLCLMAEPLFVLWTRGAVNFDAVLFLTLLAVVLIFASGQPAFAILQGQNRIAWLLSGSVAAALVLGVFSLVLIPVLGLQGAGFALLGAELCAMALAIVGAGRALRQSGLTFPLHSFALVIANITAVFALTLLAVAVFAEQPVLMVLPFVVNALFATVYWATIPVLARDRIRVVLVAIRARLPGRTRIPGPNQ